MAAVEYEEDRSLNEEEQECAASALASVPQELAAGAFGGDTALLSQLLARCVRGEKQNAAKSLQSTLTWRKDMEADTVLHRHLPGSPDFHAAWPGCVGGTDSAGHVVWCEQLCGLDVNTLAALPERLLVALRMQTMEALELRKRECSPPGRVYRQHVYVLDCRGVHAGLLLSAAARRVMRVMSTVSAQHYTETLLRCYLVHTHPSARLVWAAIRPLLPPETAAKVRFCGGPKDFLRIMAQDGIPASALPPSLEGTCEAVSVLDVIDRAIEDHAARKAAEAAALAPATPPALHRDDSAKELKGKDPRGWSRLRRKSGSPTSSPKEAASPLDEITLEQIESRPLTSRLARASWSAASLLSARGRTAEPC